MESNVGTVHLTSKHQLTIPSVAVHRLQLVKGDLLEYRLTDDTITLRQRPTIRQRLQSIWEDNAQKNHGTASDVSIKQTLGDHYRKQRV